MGTYLYELPTTGAVSFNDFCVDKTASYASEIASATQARQNLRAALKESKRAEGEKDFLRLVKAVDDYLPHLYAVKACFDADEIVLSQEPVFSWRSTISSNLFDTSPRRDVGSLYADLSFSLLTYAFTLSNLARSTVAALGAYETDRGISDVLRKSKDDKLNFAVTLLCRASGVFKFVSETILSEWDRAEASAGVSPSIHSRPLDVSPDVTNALSKLALADAQTLAIRKLLSKSAYDSTISPGPPFPSSHPSPALLAKLHLECASLYSSARALASTKSSSGDGSGGVSHSLRHYLSDNSALSAALAHKWLGVDAGENGGASRAGYAVAFLSWSKSELEALQDASKKLALAGISANINGPKSKSEDRKDAKGKMKEIVTRELESVKTFETHYKKMNDSLHFERVPGVGEVANSVPEGRAAVSVKPYVAPVPSFGPGSVEYVRRKAEEVDIGAAEVATEAKEDVKSERPAYVGAGSYF